MGHAGNELMQRREVKYTEPCFFYIFLGSTSALITCYRHITSQSCSSRLANSTCRNTATQWPPVITIYHRSGSNLTDAKLKFDVQIKFFNCRKQFHKRAIHTLFTLTPIQHNKLPSDVSAVRRNNHSINTNISVNTYYHRAGKCGTTLTSLLICECYLVYLIPVYMHRHLMDKQQPSWRHLVYPSKNPDMRFKLP